MIVDSGASIPRAIADDQFLEHFHDDDTTTANLKCDEILDHIGPSSVPDPPTLKRPHLHQSASVQGTKGASPISSTDATDQVQKD
jgi:hypothetical protein